jgi:branched-subunit amino acid transport protein
MAEASIWAVVALGGLATYLIRLSFIALIPSEKLPAVLRRGLRFIPPAVLSAIVLPELALRDGRLALSLDNDRLLAGLAAALVAWRLRNSWLTIGAGMLALVLLSLR